MAAGGAMAAAAGGRAARAAAKAAKAAAASPTAKKIDLASFSLSPAPVAVRAAPPPPSKATPPELRPRSFFDVVSTLPRLGCGFQLTRTTWLRYPNTFVTVQEVRPGKVRRRRSTRAVPG
jgi:hypothetical protein